MLYIYEVIVKAETATMVMVMRTEKFSCDIRTPQRPPAGLQLRLCCVTLWRHLRFSAPVNRFNAAMTRPQSQVSHGLRRRPSRLGRYLANKKLEDARQMSAEQRMLLALELSDICQEMRRACSAKP